MFRRQGSGFRYVHQRDAMQCGVACLAMACSCLGRRVDVLKVEEFCSPTAQGVSLKGLADAARALGFDARPAKVTMEYLCSGSALPMILHWNQNHFVLLRRVSRSGKRLLIADPAKGERWFSREEVRSRWLPDAEHSDQGIVLLLEAGEEFHAQARSERTERGAGHRSWPFIASFLKPFRRQLAVVLLMLLAGSLIQLVFPFLTQMVVDRGVGEKNIPLIWLILLGELVLVAGRTLTSFIRGRLLLKVSMHVNIRMLTTFFLKLMRLPMDFFETKLLGDMMQRMNDHQRVQSFLTGQALGIAFTMLSFLVFGVVLLIYSPLIFGVFLAGSVAYGLWIASFLKRRKVLDYETFEAQSINQNHTYQLLTTMQEIKLQDCRERRSAEWEDAQMRLFSLQMRSLRLQQTQEGGSVFINEVKNILITVLSATAVVHGQLSLGGMLAIQFIVGQLSSPVEQFMSFIYALQDVRISMERISDIHRREDEDAAALPAVGTQGDGLEVSDLSFRYDRHNPRLVIDNLSLEIPRGKVTAIVGASGSGKTTLIKLLLGFYRPERGSIRVEGADLSTLSKEAWRARCGVVMQDGVIFSDTIAHNIAMGQRVDEERLREAARMARVQEMVESMPMGYATKIGADGLGLSRGQKQRILIARAIYRRPEYIFLDEATNSLDATNERMIVEGLADFYCGRTVVVVAHRLSTVRDADNIIVLEGGRIVQQGTHEQLLATRGAYYALIHNQLELGE